MDYLAEVQSHTTEELEHVIDFYDQLPNVFGLTPDTPSDWVELPTVARNKYVVESPSAGGYPTSRNPLQQNI